MNWEKLFDTLTCHVYWKDTQGVIRGCNLQQAKDLGFQRPEDVIGKTDMDFLIPEDAEKVVAIDDYVMISKKQYLAEEDCTFTDGREITFLSYKAPLIDRDNKVLGVVGISFDITDKKKEEQKILHDKEEAEITLDSILSNLPGHVYWLDRNNVFIGCNIEQARVFGLASPKEIRGKTVYDFERKEDADYIVRINNVVMKTGQSITAEEPFLRPDGKFEIYLSTKTPLKNKQNEIIGTMGMSINITAQKEAEAREKNAIAESTEAKLKAQNEEDIRKAVMILTGSIAHDLRTPIATVAMTGSVVDQDMPQLMATYQQAVKEKLIAEPLSDLRMNSFNKLGQNLQKIAEKMNNYIDVTLATLTNSLTKSPTKTDLIICSIDHCVGEMMHYYSFDVSSEKELIHWDRSNDFEFLGNEILMIRILSNLIKNSLEQIKLKSKGEIFITTDISGTKNILRIKDTAGGAPPEVVQNIFNGYYTTKIGGTGIGLAFCKKTMQDFGGDITCDSVYGDYIEFILTFPKLGESKLAVSTPADKIKSAKNSKNPKNSKK